MIPARRPKDAVANPNQAPGQAACPTCGPDQKDCPHKVRGARAIRRAEEKRRKRREQ